MSLPQVRAAPWYQGQIGVPGSDVQRGLRWESCGIVLFVDENHPNATAFADGTDPENPLNSIQTAVDRLTQFATAMAPITLEGSVIVVANEATIAESVIINPTAPKSCTILGAGGSRHQPTWTAATAPGTALILRQQGWVIEGFTFGVGALGTAIRLSEVPGSSYISYKTMIRDCQFDGLFGGQYGIDFYGAPHRVTVEGCEFIEFHTVATDAFAICVTDSAHTNPNQCRILNNMFWQNDNHIGSVGNIRSFNASEFRGNTFMALADAGIVTALKLDLRGGSVGLNIVTQNVFCGDYATAGGYWDNAVAGRAGMWVGNIAEDVASGQVADNGFTVAVPV